MAQLSAYRFPESSGGLKWELWKHIDGATSTSSSTSYNIGNVHFSGNELKYKKYVALCIHIYGTLVYSTFGVGGYYIQDAGYNTPYIIFSNNKDSGMGTESSQVNNYQCRFTTTNKDAYNNDSLFYNLFDMQNTYNYSDRTMRFTVRQPDNYGNNLIQQGTQLSLDIYAMFLPEFEIK